jgi:hypothetical protein
MVADAVSCLPYLPGQGTGPAYVISHHEKGRLHPVLVQGFQHKIGHSIYRPIVKRQKNIPLIPVPVPGKVGKNLLRYVWYFKGAHLR